MDLFLSNVGFKNGFRGFELEELTRLMTAFPTASHIVTDTMLKPGHPNPVMPAGMEVFRQDRTLDLTNPHGGVAVCVNGAWEPLYGLSGEIPDCDAEFLCVTCTVHGTPCAIISAYIKPIESNVEGRHVRLTEKLRELTVHYHGFAQIVGGDFYFTPALNDAFLAMCAEHGLVEKIGGLTLFEWGGDQLISKPGYLLVSQSDNYRPAVLSVFGTPEIYAEKLSDHTLVYVEWVAESLSASQNVVVVATRRKGSEKKKFYCIRRDCKYSLEKGFVGFPTRHSRRMHEAEHEGFPKMNVGPGAIVKPNSKHAKQKKKSCLHCGKVFGTDHFAQHVARCAKNPARVPSKKRKQRECPFCKKMFADGSLSKHKKVCRFRGRAVSRSGSRPRSLPKLPVEIAPERPVEEVSPQTPYEL